MRVQDQEGELKEQKEEPNKELVFSIDLQIVIINIILLIHTGFQFVFSHSDFFSQDIIKSFNVAYLTIILWFFEKNYSIIFKFFNKHIQSKTIWNQFLIIVFSMIIAGVVLLIVTLVFETGNLYNYMFLLADWLTVCVLLIMCQFSKDNIEILMNTNRVVNSYGIFIQFCYIILRGYQYRNYNQYKDRLIIDIFTFLTRLYLFLVSFNKSLLRLLFLLGSQLLIALVVASHLYNFAIDIYFVVIDRSVFIELLDALIELSIYTIYSYMFFSVYREHSV